MGLLGTVVAQSANAAQVFALIALILFVIAGIIALVVLPRTIWAVLICAGLAFVSASLLFVA
jgi:hypothetical protein